MFDNEWVVSGSFDPAAADIWVIDEEAWPHCFSKPLPIQVDTPVLLLGPTDRPVVLVPHKNTPRRTQAAFRDGAKIARGTGAHTIGIALNGLAETWQRAALWGMGQGIYQFQPQSTPVEGPRVVIVSPGGTREGDRAILSEQMRVRDWVNMPSNLKPPQKLAEYIQDGSPDTVRWQVFDHEALAAMGAGGILAVGQGSHRPPVMLTGRYEGNPGGPWLALVGKGIIFDSGGISLKPGEGMGRMKGDMGGAAAVAGALRAVARIGVRVNVLAVLPLAENLPGGGAYRPGDILTMMDGTTVEVISTDAEGRLVLGDGVTWAVRQGVDAVVDMATLTGANVVALGGIRSGLISNNSELAERVKAACEAAAEPTWELPHDEDYQDLIKTSAADIKNSGGRPAGTVTAGLFIGHFAQDTPWAHLDIAGLSFSGEGGSIGAGATGYGVASLVELCRSWAQ